MRPTLISDLRRLAKFYNLSYPATHRLFVEAADELENAESAMMEATNSNYNDDVEMLSDWLNHNNESEPE